MLASRLQYCSYGVVIANKGLAWSNLGATFTLGVLPVGRWVHVALTFSNGMLRTLIDGAHGTCQSIRCRH